MNADERAKRAERAAYMGEYRKRNRPEPVATPDYDRPVTRAVMLELDGMPEQTAGQPGLAESCRRIADRLDNPALTIRDYTALARELRIALKALRDAGKQRPAYTPRLLAVAQLAHRHHPEKR